MSSLFTKQIQQLTADDVQRLIAESVPESSTVEFKEMLPHKGGVDGWYSGANKIGDYARDQVLEEVIAFANAHGGLVVIGIKESNDQPHRAEGIAPVPRCDELADRFRLMLRDCVEPQIPLVQVAGVRTAGDSGVVVIRVPESRMAPHRHKSTLHCYYRRSDRTEKMTMRDIQDLTLTVSRRLENIERTYEKRSADFRKWIKTQSAVGVRATAVPLSPLNSGRVFGNSQLFPYFANLTLTIGGMHERLTMPMSAYNQRPILRGAQRVWQRPKSYTVVQEVHDDGIVEARTLLCPDTSRLLRISLILGAAATSLVLANTFRHAVAAPVMEYGLEMEVYDAVSLLTIGQFSALSLRDEALPGPIESPLIFPRYSLGSESEIGRLMEILTRDIFDAAGDEAPAGPYSLSWS